VNSSDGVLHVDAHRRSGADVAIAVQETARGVAMCFDGCASDQRRSGRWNDLLTSVFGARTDVDVAVQVPPGIRLVAGTVVGDITVEGIQGDIRAVTVSGRVSVHDAVFNAARIQTVHGDVAVELPPGASVRFTAHTASGVVNSAIPIDRGRRGIGSWSRGFVANSNDPDPALTVTTSDGDITVRRR
jgi:hypothetical protein